MKNDPFSYLKKTGAIGVSHKAIAVSGSARGKGALGSSSEEKKGLAKRANIEGNESAHYERLEKRSLRSLKQGGSEKELRQGHNDGGKMAKGGGYKTPAKVKPTYSALTNPIKAAKQERRADIKAAKATGDKAAVKTAKAIGKDTMRVARGVRQARNEAGLRKSDKAAGHQARAVAAEANQKLRVGRRQAKKGLAALV